jgi:hypothetical protein
LAQKVSSKPPSIARFSRCCPSAESE